MVSRAKDFEARLGRAEEQLRLLQSVSRFMVREMSLSDILSGINKLMS